MIALEHGVAYIIACNSNYEHWLSEPLHILKLSDLQSHFLSIHLRHVQVSEDQLNLSMMMLVSL